MAQPAEVFVSETETLPRELVASVARRSCKRCGGQGWYWFWRGAKRAPFVCPCAQERVRANIAKAQAADRAPTDDPRALIAQAAKQLQDSGGEPFGVVVDVATARSLARAAGQEHGGAGEFVMPFGEGLDLHVLPVVDAPPQFARIFSHGDYRQLRRELAAQQDAAAARQAQASRDLEEQRAALVAAQWDET